MDCIPADTAWPEFDAPANRGDLTPGKQGLEIRVSKNLAALNPESCFDNEHATELLMSRTNN